MDSQQSKSGKFVPYHPFRKTLPWESPGLCIGCPWVSSGWVQRMYCLTCLFFLFLQTTTTATILAHELQKSLVGAKLKSCVPRWEMGPKNCEGSGTLARRVSVSGLLCGRLTHMGPDQALSCLCAPLGLGTSFSAQMNSKHTWWTVLLLRILGFRCGWSNKGASTVTLTLASQ